MYEYNDNIWEYEQAMIEYEKALEMDEINQQLMKEAMEEEEMKWEE